MPLEPNLRVETALTPDDIVVRGGEFDWDPAERSVQRCFGLEGFHALSFAAKHGATIDEICARKPQSNWKKVRIASYGAVVAAQFELVPTFGSPHYSLLLTGPLTVETWQTLTGVFNETVDRQE